MTDGPVMVVTGTRKGIGRHLAQHYLDQGYRVAGCSRGEGSIQDPGYLHFQMDVADEPSVVELFKTVGREWGRVDALLNNAGIASMNHVMLTPGSSFSQVLETNVLGAFLFAREAAKRMMRRRQGRIVNFATVASPLRLEGEAAYAASKAAVVNFTEIMAREVADLGITVNAVGPTPVPTDLIRSVPQEKMEALLARQAIRRFGSMEDIVNVIDFFLKPESDFITGQVIYLGGVPS
jgi:3-oxoacyl-[acyl-carrier protein] reductase